MEIMTLRFAISRATIVVGLVGLCSGSALAQQGVSTAQKPDGKGSTPAAADPTKAPSPPTGITPPPGYVIGVQDVLSIVFWRDKDMSADVTVRPDGKISLPLLNEIQAAGSTPEQLRTKIQEAAGKYIEEPNATVVVREIHSRNVFITGNVAKPGTYTLVGNMNVLQLIALAGGVLEFADAKNIKVIQTDETGAQKYHKFNYNDVVRQKHVEQNIVLRPNDTVIVP
jgi:polysaccharide biosynthesis/export protein